MQVLWVYHSSLFVLPLSGRQSSLTSSAGGQGGMHVRREGTHLAGSVCAIIVTYPMVHTAFSSSGGAFI